MADETSTLHSTTHTVDEETPLLSNAGDDPVYDRFSKSKKKAIVAIVSFAGLIPRELPHFYMRAAMVYSNG